MKSIKFFSELTSEQLPKNLIISSHDLAKKSVYFRPEENYSGSSIIIEHILYPLLNTMHDRYFPVFIKKNDEYYKWKLKHT